MKIKFLDDSHHEDIFSLVEAVIAEQGLRAEFYWPEEMLQDELGMTEALGLFKSQHLAAVVLYRPLPGAWEISLLATAPPFRKQGYMETLLRHLIDAKGRERELWLEVHEKNLSAQNLYEKIGFKKTGVRNKYYKDGAAAWLYSYPGSG